MINKAQAKTIHSIWDSYINSNKKVLDTKGNPIKNINENRIKAIADIKNIINTFLLDEIAIYEFKTNIDSYNKRNNLWGFTAVKGQMFFNQLVRNSDANIDKLTALLKSTLLVPENLNEALQKINTLEKFCAPIFNKAEDKRKAANPGSVGYFLSYFWQIQDYKKWAILYTSMINAFKELGTWTEHSTQKNTYEFFYKLNEEVKDTLKSYTKHEISNWDVEHALWEFKGNPNADAKVKKESIEVEIEKEEIIKLTASFELNDYLIPKVANLIELGSDKNKTSAEKGSQYEKLVAEIFKQLDFEVEILGQGKGREPDAILKFREDNTAFLVDAKAYSEGYSLGVDDRAIREYINFYTPKLSKQGFKKIGFIIVSNSFKSNFDSFINDVTWSTDIKRFMLIRSEALLYLLAYKTKDKIALSSIIESLVGWGNLIQAQDVIEKYDDI